MSFMGSGFIPPVFHPSQLSGLLWYDARDNSTITTSSGKVTNWVDKIGGSIAFNDASNATRRPTITTDNGVQCFDFDGSANALFGDTNAKAYLNNKAGCTFVVLCKPDVVSGTLGLVSYSTNASGSTPRAELYQSAYAPYFQGRQADADSTSTFSGGAGVNQRGYFNTTDWHLLAVTVSQSGQTVTTYRDGFRVEATSSFGNAGNYTNSSSVNACIGRGVAGGVFNGKIAAVFVRDRVSTAAEMEALFRFIRREYKLSTEPRRHILLVGDSIAANSYISTYPQVMHWRLWNELGAHSYDYVHNLAVDGRKISDLVSNASEVTGFNWAIGAKKIVVINCGTNDLNAGDSVATVTGRLTSFTSTIKAAHPDIKVVYNTVIARENLVDATRTAYNADVITNKASYGVDVIADWASDANFDAQADCDSTTYYNDDPGVHPKDAGIQVGVGTYMVPAVNSLGFA